MMNKADIRKRVMERVRQMSVEERRLASGRIADQVMALPAYRRARTIMAYSSMPTEPDTKRIMEDAVRRGKTVLLPRCRKAPEMEALPWRGEEYMQPGPWGILEPVAPAGEEAGMIPEPELILVPCVAATRKGVRLGHGAGYYDWYLQDRNAMKVCLCFQTQLVESLPMEGHDIPMDLVIWGENR